MHDLRLVQRSHVHVAFRRPSRRCDIAKPGGREIETRLTIGTGNTGVIVRLLMPFVLRVVVANPLQVRLIAWAKVKTDKIDAGVLAKLYASGFLPEVWVQMRR